MSSTAWREVKGSFGRPKAQAAAEALADEQRSLLWQLAVLKRKLAGVDPHVEAPNLEIEYENARLGKYEAEVYARALSVCVLRDEVARTQLVLERERARVSEAETSSVATETSLRRAVLAYVEGRVADAARAMSSGTFDMGHVRTLAEAGLVGIAEAAAALADLAQLQQNAREEWFWRTRQQAGSSGSVSETIANRIADLEASLTEQDWEHIRSAEQSVAAEEARLTAAITAAVQTARRGGR